MSVSLAWHTLTLSYLRVPLEIFIWTWHIFGNNFRINNDFTKYLKESCWKCSDEDFSNTYFPNFAFTKKNTRLVLACRFKRVNLNLWCHSERGCDLWPLTQNTSIGHVTHFTALLPVDIYKHLLPQGRKWSYRRISYYRIFPRYSRKRRQFRTMPKYTENPGDLADFVDDCKLNYSESDCNFPAIP